MDADRYAARAAQRKREGDDVTDSLRDFLIRGSQALAANSIGSIGDLAKLGNMLRGRGDAPGYGSDEVARDAFNMGDSPLDQALLLAAGLIAPGPGGKAKAAKFVRKAAGQAAEEAEAAGRTVSRAKRVVGTTNQYVGAPPGIDSPQKFSALVDQYVNRIDEAMQNGVPRGYFYEQGTNTNRQLVGGNPDELRKLAMTEGVTSSVAPVHNNFGWSVKGLEQSSMGVPIRTGLYPTEPSKKIAAIEAGETPYIGTKTHRYSHGLMGDAEGLAPNDRWEMRGMGYNTESPTAQQHDFMDEVRQRAAERWNARHPDQKPLSILEAQELNWATVRARDLKIPHTQAAENITDTAERFGFQHSWESRGGERAQHLRDMDAQQLGPYHEAVKQILLDPASGRDQVIDAMGGRLQKPAVDVPGVFEGVVSPSTQSTSLVYQTAEGMDPTSLARVQGTEAARGYMLGQDMYAGHSILPGKPPSGPKTDTLSVNLGRPPTQEEAVALEKLIVPKLGDVAIVGTPKGFNVLRLDFNGANPKFAAQADALNPEIRDVVGDFESRRAGRAGFGEFLDWEGGNATRDMLAQLDNPNAPRLKDLADAPKMREIAGALAELYEKQKAAGVTPNAKLVNALRVWQTQGLAGLRDLVAKGLAPALGATAVGVGAAGALQDDQ